MPRSAQQRAIVRTDSAPRRTLARGAALRRRSALRGRTSRFSESICCTFCFSACEKKPRRRTIAWSVNARALRVRVCRHACVDPCVHA
jgi:hypothetical protein